MNASPNSGPEESPVPHLARAERLALCELMDRLGPDAATLCGDWTTADLAAHLVIRERRPDAAAGILFGPLAGHAERVRRAVRDAAPFPELVDRIRQGPPRASLLGLPGVDQAANSVEYFVHHEDVRRAQPDWQPRELSDETSEILWKRGRMARLILRKVPVDVTLVRPDGKAMRVSKGGRQARVHGPVGELILWVTGRAEVAQVRFTGEADAVRILAEARWGL